jgi:hypothetical protein
LPQVLSHQTNPFEVLGRVEPQPARRAHRPEQPVPPLPGAKHVRADA